MRGSNVAEYGVRDDNSGQTTLGSASAHELLVQYMGIAQTGATLHLPAAAAYNRPHTHCCSWCCCSKRHTSKH